MKRYTLIAVAAVLVLAAGVAIAYTVGGAEEKGPEVLDPVAYLEEEAAGVGSDPLEVPVYGEEALVKPDNPIFRFGRDNGYRKDLGSRGESIEALQAFFPRGGPHGGRRRESAMSCTTPIAAGDSTSSSLPTTITCS